MTIADRLLSMYIHPWFPPGRECSDDQLLVRDALLAAHRAALDDDREGTIASMRTAASCADAILWRALSDHVREFIERFDLIRIAQYDQATREAAERWVSEHNSTVNPGDVYNRLIADTCAQLHLANTGRWKP